MANKAVFVDRDGVINRNDEHYYIFRQSDFTFNEDIFKSLKLLKDAGFLLILVSNQGGVAKGLYTCNDVDKLHNYMQNILAENNASFDAIYYCPHHDSISDCNCRKPKPEMIIEAAKKHDIDLAQSFLIGDSQRDIDAGEAAGVSKCFKSKANSSILNICESIVSQSI